MQLVHHAPRAVALAALAAVALAGCGGDSAGNQQAAELPGFVAPINLADCADWNEASTEDRLATIEQIRNYTGGPVAGADAEGSVLDDDRAYDLFENYCSNEFARGFKLYKLYGRAAAFQNAADAAEDSSSGAD